MSSPKSTVSPVRRIVTVLGCAAIFLVALIGASWIARAIGPQAPIPQVTDKLAEFAKIEREVNVLFFGSSKTYSGIIPQIFDQVARSEGVRVRSFNAGIDGMQLPETGWYCEQYLARRSPALQWVFLEFGSVRTKTQPGHQGTRRASVWRDWPRTRQMVKATRLLHPDSPDLLQEQLWLGLERFVNLGEGAAWHEHLLVSRSPAKGRDEIRATDRGYTPIPFPMRANERADFAQKIAAMSTAQGQPLDLVSEEVLHDLMARIREAGATPVLLVAPNPTRARALSEAFMKHHSIVWDYARPDLYPELYSPENRSDFAHLNHVGAQAWTTHLARKFVGTVRPSPQR